LRSSSVQRILQTVPDDAVVLDIGGWGKPFPRADWVMDLMPYDGRGVYGYETHDPERFTRATWIQRDICDREPFPFADKSIDFVICSHTLEDIRDPIWVCQEMQRIARAGYIETPSRLEEQTAGVQGPWVGWGHHRWLVEVRDGALEFVFKHHVICGRERAHLPRGILSQLSEDERTLAFWWEGSFECSERVFIDAEGLDPYLEGFVASELARRSLARPLPSARRSLRAALAGPPGSRRRALARRLRTR
jgi:hypothetical protein